MKFEKEYRCKKAITVNDCNQGEIIKVENDYYMIISDIIIAEDAKKVCGDNCVFGVDLSKGAIRGFTAETACIKINKEVVVYYEESDEIEFV